MPSRAYLSSTLLRKYLKSLDYTATGLFLLSSMLSYLIATGYVIILRVDIFNLFLRRGFGYGPMRSST